ncbi:hypothetical protein HHK36_028180 [Tetracentron sinense]|uniref:HMA domain-containing protein n=1 Tax=Tetracentron sinense TaxID=13715 RepID=A0A834YI00_TETSI|nr:hypothetical protein HHK36_028180 [Tetracentron sinense]
MEKQEKKPAEGGGVITAVYKVNLHCQQCAREVEKPLMRTQGVQSVDIDIESGEIKVRGKVDAKIIHERIQKITRKKVEMVSLPPKLKDGIASEKKDTKEIISSTTTVKVHMHCEKCEYDLRRKIIKLKGVHSVNTNMEAQTLTVDGTIESHKLVEYISKKVHKHAEIMTPKPNMKVEKKVEVEKVEKKLEVEKKVEIKEGNAKIVEFKSFTEYEEETKVELKGNAPYFVHYVYAPPLFSDENPNACSIM